MLQTYQCMLLGVCGTRTEPSLQFLNIQEREMNDSADALCVCYLLTLWHTNYAAESTKGMSDDQCAGKVQPECSVCCRCLQSFTRKVLGACTTAAYPSTARLCQSCLGYSYGPYLRTLLQTLVLIISTSSSIENHLPTTPLLAHHFLPTTTLPNSCLLGQLFCPPWDAKLAPVLVRHPGNVWGFLRRLRGQHINESHPIVAILMG